jgi:C1A family cysteine protease
MKHALGYIPDVPDLRDKRISDLRAMDKFEAALPSRVDMRAYFSPIENQGRLSSCTAQAGVGAMEMLALLKQQPYQDLSRLFLYKITRELLGWTGDVGGTLRATAKAMVKYGVCPESMWPYITSTYERAPTSSMMTAASQKQVLKYYRCTTLDDVKWCLANGLPVIIGFSCYDHAFNPGPTGRIEMPSANTRLAGGHAVCLTGYDDSRRCVLIRNSWGNLWGNFGYGELVYDYFSSGLASDIWSLAEVE